MWGLCTLKPQWANAVHYQPPDYPMGDVCQKYEKNAVYAMSSGMSDKLINLK